MTKNQQIEQLEALAAKREAGTATMERPAWATEAITEDAGKPDEWHRYFRRLAPAATYSEPGSTDEYPATFTLEADDVDCKVYVRLDGEDFGFHSPEQARSFAVALEAVADEWDRINNEAFARRLATNCESLGIDHMLTERQLNGVDAVYMHDLARIMDRHGADARDLLRGTY